jgi:hypothetical protein
MSPLSASSPRRCVRSSTGRSRVSTRTGSSRCEIHLDRTQHTALGRFRNFRPSAHSFTHHDKYPGMECERPHDPRLENLLIESAGKISPGQGSRTRCRINSRESGSLSVLLLLEKYCFASQAALHVPSEISFLTTKPKFIRIQSNPIKQPNKPQTSNLTQPLLPSNQHSAQPPILQLPTAAAA